jgi:choline dehydrogenase-like flavoprotein
MQQHICVIGCGTFGSYLVRRLYERHGTALQLTVIEIGDRRIRSESDIGIETISPHSSVSRAGRYFGLGGTSARWGGQVLFFDDRDNPSGDPAWNEIIRINRVHREKVLRNLLGDRAYHPVEDGQGPVKTGIWLKYTRRNMYRRLQNGMLRHPRFLTNRRVTGFVTDGRRIVSVRCKSEDGREEEISADLFYLTAGALESCRLLLLLDRFSGLFAGTDLGRNFGDHISTELFTVRNSAPVLRGTDLTPRMHKGSLVTRRLVVTTAKGVVGFLHPVLNKDIKAFKFLKELLFGKRSTTVTPAELLQGAVFLFRFAFSLAFRNKLYVDRTQWSLQLDMEQPVPNANRLTLSDRTDRFGEPVLEIDWKISGEDLVAIADVRQQAEQWLRESGLSYRAAYDPASTGNKVEDVYHPVGSIRMGTDPAAVAGFDGRIRGLDNLFHFSTALFPRAGSINPSAAVFCILEEHLEKYNFSRKSDICTAEEDAASGFAQVRTG